MINNKNIIELFITFMMLISCIGLSTAESISGYVSDTDGLPINGITISDNASIGTTNTNSTGYYYINGYTNLSTYILSTSKTGYIDNTLSIDVNDNITNANITITEKGMLYDIFTIMSDIVDNAFLIIGLIILSVTIGLCIVLGAWITKLLPKGK